MVEDGIFVTVAEFFNAPEAAIRLVISLFIGYPIAFIHRILIYDKSPNLQHLYFIICGMSLCYFNYGSDIIHSFLSISIVYVILKLIGGTLMSLLIVFIYTMCHLFFGYLTTATSNYDIMWTMPQCVLTLRLIGLAFNLYDGCSDAQHISEENKKVSLNSLPSALEVFAHSYYPSSFLVGPQLPLKRYLDFVSHKLEDKPNPDQLPSPILPGLMRGFIGFVYLVINQVGFTYVNDDFIISPEFKELSMWKRYFILGIWSRLTLYKYISCWLITEGSCIVTGLTYNGVDLDGKVKWDGCSNVRLKIFETATKMNHYIESFNINTNQWVAQYIYKRLKFLNNRMLSHLGALLFLAVWHGFHSGYYATFFFEFIVITAEKNVTTLTTENQLISSLLKKTSVKVILYVFQRIYTFIVMGYAMIPFILLKYKKYMPVFYQFYFLPHIICILIVLTVPVLRKYLSASSYQVERRSRTQLRNDKVN